MPPNDDKDPFGLLRAADRMSLSTWNLGIIMLSCWCGRQSKEVSRLLVSWLWRWSNCKILTLVVLNATDVVDNHPTKVHQLEDFLKLCLHNTSLRGWRQVGYLILIDSSKNLVDDYWRWRLVGPFFWRIGEKKIHVELERRYKLYLVGIVQGDYKLLQVPHCRMEHGTQSVIPQLLQLVCRTWWLRLSSTKYCFSFNIYFCSFQSSLCGFDHIDIAWDSPNPLSTEEAFFVLSTWNQSFSF